MQTYTAFEGNRRIASGDLKTVALKVKKVVDRGERRPVLIFDDHTSEVVELDLRGTPADMVLGFRSHRRRHSARSGTPETRCRSAGGHAAPAPLGVVEPPAGRGFRRVEKAG